MALLKETKVLIYAKRFNSMSYFGIIFTKTVFDKYIFQHSFISYKYYNI